MITKFANTLITLTSTCWLAQACPASSKTLEFVAHICSNHVVSDTWQSKHPALGRVSMRLDTDSARLSLDMSVSNFSEDELAAAGPSGVLGAIHIHNLPQGGPQFFVQQLPGKIISTDTGFDFILENWSMTAPMGGAKVSVEFVIAEILSGNAYIGVHSSRILCEDATRREVACSAPATALSGTLIPVNDDPRKECSIE